MSVERGWVSVYGVVISAYCYIILFTMSLIFLLGGTLLTGIALRPQQVYSYSIFTTWGAPSSLA